ncbi:MAG: choice-of-anchor J domain-containing protein [Bacteroidales bacterium]|nr:choice-of-anchor J domain-containing protein [Bacteroidales bacterium]
MKKLTFLAVISALFLGSCVQEDFDVPDIVIPYVDFSSNMSIADLKATYVGVLDSIGEDTIIEGIVIANDESGNFYKTIVIQDNTAGIEVKIDRYDMYTEFKVGQRVFIKCRGLYLGDYGGLTQLGYIYAGDIGRIPDIMVDDHIFRDSLPEAAPTPTLLTIPTLSPTYLSMLVRIDSVHFIEVGQPFAESTATTNRTVEDASGNQLLIRTSNYASFAADNVPAGMGSIVGVLSIYNGDYQFYLRDLNDIVAWDYGAATEQNIIFETFDTDPSWTIFSAASNEDWYWDASYACYAVSGYGGDVASDDYLVSPAINLTGVTNPILSFRTWTKYTDGGFAQPVEVMISTNYTGTGDPTIATWTNLTATWSPSNSQSWTSSGDIDLSAYIGNTVYIAFRYQSSGTGTGTTSNWEVDEFKVKAVM